MGEVQVGPWTLAGTDRQNEILLPMYAKMVGVLALPDGSSRVKPARVVVRPRDKMPWAKKPVLNPDGTVKTPGVRATGYWNGTNQLIAADQFDNPDKVRKIGAHETTHQLDDQWMRRSHENDIRPLFDPEPARWAAEEFAVYGSAAIFGFDNPPYTDFYDDYVIPRVAWPKVKQIALRDDRPTTDPCLPYKAEIATLKTTLADTEAARVAAVAAQRDAEAALAQAKLDLTTCDEALAHCEGRIVAKDDSMKEGLEK